MSASCQRADNIRVAVRIRPFIKREKDSQCTKHWKASGNCVVSVASNPKDEKCFYLDKVFDERSSTLDVYQDFAAPVVLSALKGFNGTIFAYGQTSSGKTYTMMGNVKDHGVIRLAMEEIFNYIAKQPGREYLIRCSYLEIYNENITDLLKPGNKNLDVREKPEIGFFVDGIHEVNVIDSDGVFSLMDQGERNRHYGKTDMNERSSRSHTIFQMVIESRELQNSMDSVSEQEVDQAIMVAQLNLVDLAGSERASSTGAEGVRLKEGCNINKSLFTLGSVISKLSEGAPHVNFRDSKLTRILKKSLGGNAKTSIICTITSADLVESQSTLEFATRAKSIKNRPVVNEVMDDGTQLKRCKMELAELKRQLDEVTRNTCHLELQSENEKMAELLREQREIQEQQQKRISELMNMFCGAGSPRAVKKRDKQRRRETWAPGVFRKHGALLASTACRNENNFTSMMPLLEESEMEESFRKRLSAELDEEFRGRCSSPILTESYVAENNSLYDDSDQQVVRRKLEEDNVDCPKLVLECGIIKEEEELSTTGLDAEKQEDLQEELEQLTEEHELLKQKETKTDLLEKVLEKKSLECEKLKENLREEQDRNETLSAEVTKLKEEGRNGNFYREELEAKTKEMETLKIQFEERKQCSEELQQERDTLVEYKELNSCFQEKFEEEVKRCENLENLYREELEAKTKEMETLKMQFEEHKQRSEELQQERDTLVEYKELNSCFQEKFEEEVRRCENLEATLNKRCELEHRQEIETLQKQLQEERKQFEDLRSTCDSLKECSKLYESVQQDLQQKLKECDQLKVNLEEEQSRNVDLCLQLENLKNKRGNNGNLVKELLAEKTALEQKLRDAESRNNDLEKNLGDSKNETDLLRKECQQMKEEMSLAKNSLLRDSNRDMVQTRTIDKMKAERRETFCIQAHIRQEMEKERQDLEKKITELETKCRRLESEKDLAEHNALVAAKQSEDIKLEIKEKEKVFEYHSKSLSLGGANQDPEKLKKVVKQLELSNELTKQKLEKAEKKLKELETESRKFHAADIRISNLEKDKSSLLAQLDQKQTQQQDKDKKLNELSMENNRLQIHVEKLSEEARRNKNQMERKILKLEQLEQELSRAQGRNEVIEELNKALKTKQEQLENMTFVVDEKNMEIEEVRLALDEIKNNEKELKDLSIKLRGMEQELEVVTSELKKSEMQVQEKDQTLNEYKDIIKQQEDEMIRLKEEKGSKQSSKEAEMRCNELEKCIKEKESTIFELEAKLGCSQHELGELKFKYKDLETSLDSNRLTIDGLKSKVVALNEDLDCAHDDLLEALDRENKLKLSLTTDSEAATTLTESLESAKKMIEEGKLTLAEKQEELDALKNEKCALEERLEGVVVIENEVMQLKTNLEAAENTIADGKIALSNMQTRLDEVVAEKLELEKKLEEVAATEIEVVSLLESLDATEKSVINGEAKISELQSKIETLVKEKCEMEEQLENRSKDSETVITLTESLESAEKMIEEGKLILAEKQEELDALVNEKCALEQRLEDVLVIENEVMQLKTNLEAAENTITDGKIAFSNMQARLDEVVAEKLELEKKLEEVSATEIEVGSLDAAKKSVINGEAKISELLSRIEILVKEKCEMEEQLENRSKDSLNFESELLSLRENLSVAQKMIADGKLLLEEKDARCQSLVLEKIALEERLSRNETVGESDEKLQNLEKQICEQKELVEVLKKELEQAEKDKANLMRLHEMSKRTDAGEKCSQEMTDGSHRKLIELQTALDASCKTNARLQKDITNLKNISGGLKQHSEALEGKITKLETQKKTSEEELLSLNQLYLQSMSRIENLEDSVKSANRHKEIAGKMLQNVLDEKLQLERELEGLRSQKEEKYPLAVEEISKLKKDNKEDQEISYLNRKIEDLTRLVDEQEEKQTELEKKYQLAVEEISKLKKESKEDEKYFNGRIDHLTRLVDEQDELEEKRVAAERNYSLALQEIEVLKNSMQTNQKQEKQTELEKKYQLAMEEISKLKKESKEDEKYFNGRIDHLTRLVDEQDELEEKRVAAERNYSLALQEIEVLKNSMQTNQKQEKQTELEKKYQLAMEEISKLKKESKEDEEYFNKKIDHLTRLVDEQDELEEKRVAAERNYSLALQEIEMLKNSSMQTNQNQDSIRQLGEEKKTMARKIQALTEQIQILSDSDSRASIAEELSKAKSELAEKDLTIFNLQYQRTKDVEQLQRQLLTAKKESEHNLAKCGRLRQEIRRLREPEDTTVTNPRSDKESAGVVSSVLFHSLRSKLYERERRMDELHKKVEDLEKQKTSLEYAKAEALTQASRLRSENSGLKTKLDETRKKLKEQKSTVALNLDERAGENEARVLREVQVSHVAQRQVQQSTNDPWLTSDSLDGMFQEKDKPSHCQTQ